LIGSLIIVLHAPEDKPVETVDEILSYALRPGAFIKHSTCHVYLFPRTGFLLYCFTVLVFTLVMIYAVAPKYGRSNPVVYISICSLVGSISVMAIKGFGVAVKLTFGGKNQFSHPSTYVFGIIVALCILVQMNYFNKALDTFSTNVYVFSSISVSCYWQLIPISVNPMYYVGFSTATAVASLILFQGFNTTDATNTVSLLTGFVVTFLGVHLLNLSRAPEPPLDHNTHSALEGGLMNPRLSLQGRMSLDGWANPGDTRIGPAPSPHGHGRRSSLYRNQSSTLFNAFEEHDQNGNTAESVGLQRLREEESDDDMEDADERTRLHRETPMAKQSGSRSHSHSPIPSRPESTDVRISARTVAPWPEFTYLIPPLDMDLIKYDLMILGNGEHLQQRLVESQLLLVVSGSYLGPLGNIECWMCSWAELEKKWFNPGSNWRPSVTEDIPSKSHCETEIITTRPLNPVARGPPLGARF
jgi:hypothetical protein